MEIDKSVYVAPGAYISDVVTLKENVSVFPNAVVRGDEGSIFVDSDTNIQDCAVLHCGNGFTVHVGKGVTIGHSAIVHGSAVGDNSLIGMGAILLNGAKVGSDCIVGAGSLVTGKMVIPDGYMAFGNPCRLIRKMTPEEIESNRKNAAIYVKLAKSKTDNRIEEFISR
ncbi:MAG: gamma carbonic anhydrase family protein [Lachnospiraceae bacterium]|uniref:Gamma carbonic anhydrase family protein n=1 Tax=Candidatus Weimeria bifida TaxID=2599074 RepID=A0A6N7IZP9_9FIRM|nr:gamma carbonic anhydrase family protein [Candidatus Weimeria bifida]RRF96556.1 MAG: gamma carbonic anhydrase family protein [Lachnospiraceae bacterium]